MEQHFLLGNKELILWTVMSNDRLCIIYLILILWSKVQTAVHVHFAAQTRHLQILQLSYYKQFPYNVIISFYCYKESICSEIVGEKGLTGKMNMTGDSKFTNIKWNVNLQTTKKAKFTLTEENFPSRFWISHIMSLS